MMTLVSTLNAIHRRPRVFMQSDFIEIQRKKEILLLRENYRDTLE